MINLKIIIFIFALIIVSGGKTWLFHGGYQGFEGRNYFRCIGFPRKMSVTNGHFLEAIALIALGYESQ